MNNISKNGLPKAIFLMGPTASGKTKLAIELYKKLPVELISVDSALIYRGMDIGTAKPSVEELIKTPHRLIGIRDPAQVYSVADFRRDALSEMAKIVTIGRIPLLVGGTMLYYKALVNGLSPLPSANLKIRKKINQLAIQCGGRNALHKMLTTIDPIAADRIHPNDLQRISRALEVFLISGKTLTELTQKIEGLLSYKIYQFGIIPTSRSLLYERIEQRFYKMLDLGFEEEVQKLFTRNDLHKNMPSIRCIGYRQMWSWLENEISYDNMIYSSIHATRQLAKRQMTWLNKWNEIHWLDSDNCQQSLNKICKLLS